VNENIFRIITTIILVSGIAISFSHRFKAQKSGGSVSHEEEGVPILVLLRLAGLAVWGSVLAYLINPHWMQWSAFSLPFAIRWLGVGLGIVALPLMYWLFSSIGNNITDTVATRKNHQLVTHGPYHWVRHPLYSVGTLFFISIGLIAANWFILVMSLVALVMLLIRLPKEEAKLIEAFGDEYRAYMKKTGRLLPHL